MIKKLLSSQLRINMLSGVISTSINIVVLAVAYPIYLHFLGYEKYGVWLVLSVVLTFAQLGNLGISQAVMKLVAEEYGRGDIEGIQKYVATALAILLASGSVALVIILIFKSQIVAVFALSGDNAPVALWMLPYIGLLSIYVFVVQALNATLSGLGRMDLSNYTQVLGSILPVCVAVPFLYSGYGIESLLIGNIVSYVCIHITSVIFLRRMFNLRILRINNLDKSYCKRLLCFGGGVFGSSLINMLFSPFNKLLLARYAGTSSVPVYEIAFNGSMQIRTLIASGLKALTPEISRISANMTKFAKDRISQINRRAMKLIFLLGIPMYAGLFILITPLLKFWLRDMFVDELPGAFRIMLISSFLSLLVVPAYYTLLGLGMVRCTLIAHIILSGVCALIILTMVFVWHSISVETVSWAVLTATAISTVYLDWQNRKTIHLLREMNHE